MSVSCNALNSSDRASRGDRTTGKIAAASLAYIPADTNKNTNAQTLSASDSTEYLHIKHSIARNICTWPRYVVLHMQSFLTIVYLVLYMQRTRIRHEQQAPHRPETLNISSTKQGHVTYKVPTDWHFAYKALNNKELHIKHKLIRTLWHSTIKH